MCARVILVCILVCTIPCLARAEDARVFYEFSDPGPTLPYYARLPKFDPSLGTLSEVVLTAHIRDLDIRTTCDVTVTSLLRLEPWHTEGRFSWEVNGSISALAVSVPGLGSNLIMLWGGMPNATFGWGAHGSIPFDELPYQDPPSPHSRPIIHCGAYSVYGMAWQLPLGFFTGSGEFDVVVNRPTFGLDGITFVEGAGFLSGYQDSVSVGLIGLSVEYTYYTPVPEPETLMGDANGDGVVDAADYITMKRNFGRSANSGLSYGDFNDSGATDWDDLEILMGAMGGVSGGQSPTIPEPATLGLLAIGALAIIRGRRRRA